MDLELEGFAALFLASRALKMKLVAVFVLICLLLSVVVVHGFRIGSYVVGRSIQRTLAMEYIPDGLTKAQWEQIKKQVAW